MKNKINYMVKNGNDATMVPSSESPQIPSGPSGFPLSESQVEVIDEEVFSLHTFKLGKGEACLSEKRFQKEYGHLFERISVGEKLLNELIQISQQALLELKETHLSERIFEAAQILSLRIDEYCKSHKTVTKVIRIDENINHCICQIKPALDKKGSVENSEDSILNFLCEEESALKNEIQNFESLYTALKAIILANRKVLELKRTFNVANENIKTLEEIEKPLFLEIQFQKNRNNSVSEKIDHIRNAKSAAMQTKQRSIIQIQEINHEIASIEQEASNNNTDFYEINEATKKLKQLFKEQIEVFSVKDLIKMLLNQPVHVVEYYTQNAESSEKNKIDENSKINSKIKKTKLQIIKALLFAGVSIGAISAFSAFRAVYSEYFKTKDNNFKLNDHDSIEKNVLVCNSNNSGDTLGLHLEYEIPLEWDLYSKIRHISEKKIPFEIELSTIVKGENLFPIFSINSLNPDFEFAIKSLCPESTKVNTYLQTKTGERLNKIACGDNGRIDFQNTILVIEYINPSANNKIEIPITEKIKELFDHTTDEILKNEAGYRIVKSHGKSKLLEPITTHSIFQTEEFWNNILLKYLSWEDYPHDYDYVFLRNLKNKQDIESFLIQIMIKKNRVLTINKSSNHLTAFYLSPKLQNLIKEIHPDGTVALMKYEDLNKIHEVPNLSAGLAFFNHEFCDEKNDTIFVVVQSDARKESRVAYACSINRNNSIQQNCKNK